MLQLFCETKSNEMFHSNRNASQYSRETQLISEASIIFGLMFNADAYIGCKLIRAILLNPLSFKENLVNDVYDPIKLHLYIRVMLNKCTLKNFVNSAFFSKFN